MGITLGWIAWFYQNIGGMHPFYQFPEDLEENPVTLNRWRAGFFVLFVLPVPKAIALFSR